MSRNRKRLHSRQAISGHSVTTILRFSDEGMGHSSHPAVTMPIIIAQIVIKSAVGGLRMFFILQIYRFFTEFLRF